MRVVQDKVRGAPKILDHMSYPHDYSNNNYTHFGIDRSLPLLLVTTTTIVMIIVVVPMVIVVVIIVRLSLIIRPGNRRLGRPGRLR